MALLVHTSVVAGDAVTGWMKEATDARAPAKENGKVAGT
jgi:hypothetical protein